MIPWRTVYLDETPSARFRMSTGHSHKPLSTPIRGIVRLPVAVPLGLLTQPPSSGTFAWHGLLQNVCKFLEAGDSEKIGMVELFSDFMLPRVPGRDIYPAASHPQYRSDVGFE